MTLTAMRPWLGLSNGREVSLCRVSQASRSISAFGVLRVLYVFVVSANRGLTLQVA